ncbi:MAG: BatA domain-containing protein, partial [Candidatus Binatia bacterium]
MELLYPAGLWWLGAVPLLLVPYLIRERPRRRLVAAIFLFHGTGPARRMRVGPRLRLRPLFLLQLLILLLAVAALTRPALQARTTRSALVVDDTASLGALVASGGTRFDLLRREARAAVSADSSAVWDVYTLAPRPAVVAEAADGKAALDAVERLRPGPCPDPDDATLGAFFDELAGEGYMQVHVLTDRPVTEPTLLDVRTVGARAANLAITGFGLRPQGFASAKGEASVTIAAYAESSAKLTVVVEDADSGERLAEKEVEVAPGEPRTAALEVRDAPAYRARIVDLPSGADALPSDDSVVLSARGTGIRRVLLVSRDAELLARIPGVEVDAVSPAGYRPGGAAGHDVAIFHLTAPAEPPVVPALYLLPPPAPFLPRERATVDTPEVSFPEPTHPAVRYLNPGLLRPRRSLTFA